MAHGLRAKGAQGGDARVSRSLTILAELEDASTPLMIAGERVDPLREMFAVGGATPVHHQPGES